MSGRICPGEMSGSHVVGIPLEHCVQSGNESRHFHCVSTFNFRFVSSAAIFFTFASYSTHHFIIFLARNAMHSAACLFGVCSSCSCIVSKRLNMTWNFFHLFDAYLALFRFLVFLMLSTRCACRELLITLSAFVVSRTWLSSCSHVELI